jgi:cytochrome c-type biogenesis protein CcmH
MVAKFRLLLTLLAAVAALAVASPIAAVEPDEILPDAAMERRARAISAELRCLVCQNQSIDDSNAPLARDLRLLVRERLKAGDSDAAVKSFVVARYGEFVLLRPPFGLHTAILWLGPPLLLLATLIALLVWSRRMRRIASGSNQRLSDEEEARLAALLMKVDRPDANGDRR